MKDLIDVPNTPPLIEAADTGPFFHTDTTISGASAHNTETATSIEEAVAFYDSPAFNSSPSGAVRPIDLTETQIDDVGRFLRAVNAAFNAQLALKRLDAAGAIVDQLGNQDLAIQQELLRLANVELQDAIVVLGGVPEGTPELNPESRDQFTSAHELVDQAAAISSPSERRVAIDKARASITNAVGGLGINLTLTIGDGTVMF